jgi:hypothetical protein
MSSGDAPDGTGRQPLKVRSSKEKKRVARSVKLLSRRAHPLVFLLPLLVSTLFSSPSLAAKGEAFDFSARFTVDGVNTSIDPVNPLTILGSASSSNKVFINGPYRRILNLSALGMQRPVLTVTAERWGDNASVAEHDRGTAVAQAGTSIMNFSLVLAGASAVKGTPYLSVTADALTSAEDIWSKRSGPISETRNVSISRMVATGLLLGGKTIHFDGVPRLNTVLYRGAGLTIQVEDSTATSLIECMPGCRVKPVTFGARMISITFNRANLAGHIVDGEILIGASEAGL